MASAKYQIYGHLLYQVLKIITGGMIIHQLQKINTQNLKNMAKLYKLFLKIYHQKLKNLLR